MKKMIVAAVIAAALAPMGALAQERVGDAALGALSGAVLLGPVGLVAGAVVGYTAGPSIARSWRVNRNHPRHGARTVKRPAHLAAARTKQRERAPAPGDVTPAAGVGGPPAQGLE